MEKQELYLRLMEDLSPLKKTLSSDPSFRKLPYDFNDIMGFMDDKILHVFMKYQDTLPYEEVKAIAITSLYRVKPRLLRKEAVFVREIPDTAAVYSEPLEAYTPDLVKLSDTLGKVLTPTQFSWASAILDPPQWVLSQVPSLDVRIPSRLFLEYFEVPSGPQEIKRLNKFRKKLSYFLRKYVDRDTLSIKPEYLSLFKLSN